MQIHFAFVMLRYHSNNRNIYLNNDHRLSSISRTARYKKFTKPLLERKRRARMNRCVDELKSLFANLETEGENINKLEKADVLEMTVRYIKRITRMTDPIQEAHRFHAGFSECASEACKFLCSLPGLNSAVSHKLVQHLKQCLSKPRSLDTNFPTSPTISESAQFDTSSCTANSADIKQPTKPNDSLKLLSYQQNYPPRKPLFKLSYRYDDILIRTARTSRSIDDQNNNFMWRPW